MWESQVLVSGPLIKEKGKKILKLVNEKLEIDEKSIFLSVMDGCTSLTSETIFNHFVHTVKMVTLTD